MITRRLRTGSPISQMMIVQHRVNTLEQLAAVPSSLGIEFDVREGPPYTCVVTHDPWTDGPGLDEFLSQCHHAFYIVNIKCEGIEPLVLHFLNKYKIENYFLLDCSFPMIRKIGTKTAIRLSEYERFVLMPGIADWVWVDVFHELPIDKQMCDRLHSLGYKICLVSPELQGQPEKLQDYKNRISEHIDMVCTKRPASWQDVAVPQASTESLHTPSH